MLEKNQIVSASQTLHDHWRAGTKFAALDDWMRPGNRTEGYAIQAAIERYSTTHLFGWKIAATSEAGQKHINVVGPMAGRILAETVIPDGGTAAMLANELRQLGATLKAGRVVTTGTCHAPLPIQAGDFCAADFGVLGKVSVGFA